MKILYLFFGVLLFSMTFNSCKKASYLEDDGIHVAEVNLSTYDYLASHPNGMFDTLLLVIDHFKLKSEIDNAKTFWAASNYSVNRYYEIKRDSVLYTDENAQYTFEQFLNEIPVDSVRSYIYAGTPYDLQNATFNYTRIANVSNIDGFYYHKQKQPPLSWSYQPVYYLYYVKVRGEADQIGADGTAMVKEDDQADMRVLCQTTGIKTSSGTLLNVLTNTHTFIGDFVPLKKTGPEVVTTDTVITFTYDVSFKYNAVDYTGTTMSVDLPRLARFYGLQAGNIPGLIGSDITYAAVELDGTLNPNSTANAPGHWFGQQGQVVGWGTDARIVSELKTSTMTFDLLQFPGQTTVGTTYTIKQSLVYKDKVKGDLKAVFVFKITIK